MGSVAYLDKREDLLSVIETMLQQVKSGELVAMTWVKVYKNADSSCGWEFVPGVADCTLNGLLSGLSDLQYRMVKTRNED